MQAVRIDDFSRSLLILILLLSQAVFLRGTRFMHIYELKNMEGICSQSNAKYLFCLDVVSLKAYKIIHNSFSKLKTKPWEIHRKRFRKALCDKNLLLYSTLELFIIIIIFYRYLKETSKGSGLSLKSSSLD